MGDLEDRSVNTAPAGDPSVDVGTAEDVEAVMKKYCLLYTSDAADE